MANFRLFLLADTLASARSDLIDDTSIPGNINIMKLFHCRPNTYECRTAPLMNDKVYWQPTVTNWPLVFVTGGDTTSWEEP